MSRRMSGVEPPCAQSVAVRQYRSPAPKVRLRFLTPGMTESLRARSPLDETTWEAALELADLPGLARVGIVETSMIAAVPPTKVMVHE